MFLCGEDPISGESFEHRRDRFEGRLLFLVSVFAIDVCAYAVMNNYLHVVLHINVEKASKWSTLEVLQRWYKLHKGTVFTQQFVRGESLSDETFRNRLIDISWFIP